MASKVYPNNLGDYFYHIDGILYWKSRELDRSGFNSKYANKEAGTFNGKYLQIKLNNEILAVHVVIFILENGYQPEMVDHKDLNKLNNNPNNLRPSDKYSNNQNSPKNSTNSSGYKGVYWESSKQRWRGTVYNHGKRHHAGYHLHLEDAIKSVKDLRVKLHGEFANHG